MATATTVSLNRDEVVKLLAEVGMESVETWSNERLRKRLLKLPDILAQDGAKEPESGEAVAVLDAVLKAVEEEEDIEVVGDEPVKKQATDAGKPRKKKEEVPTAEEEETEPEITVLVSTNYEEVEKPKLVKLSKELAREFKEMQRFPRDRELKESLLNELRDEFNAGRFRGNEWVPCEVEETKETYRVNGKHTSHVAWEMFEAGKKPEAMILVRRYKAKTLEDAAYLFATFDPKWSARNKNDILNTFAASHKATQNLPKKFLGVLTSGIAYSIAEDQYRKKLTTEQQAKLLLQNEDFATWYCAFVWDEDKDAPLEAAKISHINRMAVIAAMKKTFDVDQDASNEFWEYMRDDCNDDKDAPTRVCFRFLKDARVKQGKKGVSTRELYLHCLKAWNAWRKKEAAWKWKGYKDSDKTPEAI